MSGSQSQFESQFSQISTGRNGGGALVKVLGHTVYGDSVFASATVAEALKKSITTNLNESTFSQQFGRPVKISKKDFRRQWLEDTMDDFPYWMCMLLVSQSRNLHDNENKLISVDHMYNYKF